MKFAEKVWERFGDDLESKLTDKDSSYRSEIVNEWKSNLEKLIPTETEEDKIALYKSMYLTLSEVHERTEYYYSAAKALSYVFDLQTDVDLKKELSIKITELYKKAIFSFEDEGDYTRAARSAERAGDDNEANRLYRKYIDSTITTYGTDEQRAVYDYAGCIAAYKDDYRDLLVSIHYAKMIGENNLALKIAENLGHYIEAIKICKETKKYRKIPGLKKRGCELYSKIRSEDKAKRICEWINSQ